MVEVLQQTRNEQILIAEAIIGPMFSGKTTELPRRVKRYSDRQKSRVVVKNAGDLRYSSTHIVSNDGQSLVANGTLTLDAVYEKMLQYDVVGKLWYLAFPFFLSKRLLRYRSRHSRRTIFR